MQTMNEILLDHHTRTDSDDSHRQIDFPRCNIKALLRTNGRKYGNNGTMYVRQVGLT
ncbi:hypothetical protein C1H46_024828 [Malus baccata]|uniref:Uncharacterized protein n=1 Tax=Malus baccata TaxID=106549 RepID=A0A540LT42_MALBA|nr:hypothetical protein C1H46_024828 [Malus baccata]